MADLVTRAISIRQPWARCVAIGQKTVENRSRYVGYRGMLVIHAARTADLAGDRDPRVVALYGEDPRLGAPLGAVVAVAELVDCHLALNLGPDTPTCCPPWGERTYTTGQTTRTAFHLVLAHARLLAVPVHCRGQIAVPWTLPADVAAAVAEQIGADQ